MPDGPLPGPDEDGEQINQQEVEGNGGIKGQNDKKSEQSSLEVPCPSQKKVK